MRRVVGIVVVFAVLVAACASDPVDSVENCTELAQVWRNGDQADQGFRDEVVARIAELKDDLLARGAATEAVACGLFLSQSQDPEDFFMEGDSG